MTVLFFFSPTGAVVPQPTGLRMVCSALTDKIRFGSFFLEAGIPRTFLSSSQKAVDRKQKKGAETYLPHPTLQSGFLPPSLGTHKKKKVLFWGYEEEM